jgi:hypothetical protein
MFIVALFTIAKLEKLPRCPTNDEWIRKYGIYKQWNSITKKKKILLFAGKWMELENIILSSQAGSEDQKPHVLSHIWNIELRQINKYNEKQVMLRRDHIQVDEDKRRKLRR